MVKERRLMLIGDPGTGKTTLLRSAECEVTQGHPTVYYKFLEGKKKKRSVLLSLWDVPADGGEEARAAVYPALDAALLVFSLDEPDSLRSVRRKWYPEVRSRCRRKIPLVLVGTKRDLRTTEGGDGVTYEQGLKVAEKIKAYAYVECSSMDDTEPLEAFKFAIRAAVKGSKCIVM